MLEISLSLSYWSEMYSMSFSSLRALLFDMFFSFLDRLLRWHSHSVSDVVLSPVLLLSGLIQHSTMVSSGLISVLGVWIDQQPFVCILAFLLLIYLFPHWSRNFDCNRALKRE
jgi:hypothetical protein